MHELFFLIFLCTVVSVVGVCIFIPAMAGMSIFLGLAFLAFIGFTFVVLDEIAGGSRGNDQITKEDEEKWKRF